MTIEAQVAMQNPSLGAAHRHAVYYWLLLNRLTEIHAKATFTLLSEVEAHWRQITQGQYWAAEHLETDRIACILASAYSQIGKLVVRHRLSPIEARGWYLAGLRAAEIQADQKLQSIHLSDLGEIELSIANYGEANRCFYQALQIAHEINNVAEQSRAMMGIGELYANLNDFDHAASLYRTALELARKDDFPLLEASILNQMGMLFVEHERYEDAIILLEEAVALVQQSGDPFFQISEHSSLGVAYIHMGKIERGIDILEKLLPDAKAVNNRAEQGKILGGIAVAYRVLRRTDEGIALLQHSIELARRQQDVLSLGKRLTNLALLYAQKEDVTATLNCLHQAQEIFTALNLSGYVQRVDDYIKRVHESIIIE